MTRDQTLNWWFQSGRHHGTPTNTLSQLPPIERTWIMEVEDLAECDCCNRIKPGCRAIRMYHLDTLACPQCRGE